jgi:uncharacterized protein
MSNVLIPLQEKGLLQGIPSWLPHNTQFLTIMGSHAYAVADTSVRNKVPDYDIYGWAIPPKEFIFPHLGGHIRGFGPDAPSFDQYQKPHVFEQDAQGGLGKEWDFQIYGIVKFFHLCWENNPNMIDALFTPDNCVIHCTQVGRMVRDKRKLFLSKLCWKKFRGYSHQQLTKADNVIDSKEINEILFFEDEHDIPRGTRLSEAEQESKTRGSVSSLKHLTEGQISRYLQLYQAGDTASKRFEDRKIRGQDSKFLYHIIRLLDEAEQILLGGDLDLQRAKEAMKAVRRGEWTTEDVRKFAREKEIALEAAYTTCTLPEKPPIEPIHQLLLQCLEEHYGSLSNCVSQVGWAEGTLKKMDHLLNEVRKQLYS